MRGTVVGDYAVQSGAEIPSLNLQVLCRPRWHSSRIVSSSRSQVPCFDSVCWVGVRLTRRSHRQLSIQLQGDLCCGSVIVYDTNSFRLYWTPVSTHVSSAFNFIVVSAADYSFQPHAVACVPEEDLVHVDLDLRSSAPVENMPATVAAMAAVVALTPVSASGGGPCVYNSGTDSLSTTCSYSCACSTSCPVRVLHSSRWQHRYMHRPTVIGAISSMRSSDLTGRPSLPLLCWRGTA